MVTWFKLLLDLVVNSSSVIIRQIFKVHLHGEKTREKQQAC